MDVFSWGSRLPQNSLNKHEASLLSDIIPLFKSSHMHDLMISNRASTLGKPINCFMSALSMNAISIASVILEVAKIMTFSCIETEEREEEENELNKTYKIFEFIELSKESVYSTNCI